MGSVWQGDECLATESLEARALQVATGLIEEGLSPGDGVGIYLRNDFAFFEISRGAALMGAYPVAINWHYTPAEAEYLFNDSGIKALVIHADLLSKVRQVIPDHVLILSVPVPKSKWGRLDKTCAHEEFARFISEKQLMDIVKFRCDVVLGVDWSSHQVYARIKKKYEEAKEDGFPPSPPLRWYSSTEDWLVWVPVLRFSEQCFAQESGR